jgi:hypothetical protein
MNGQALQYITLCEDKIQLQAENQVDPEDASENTFDASHVSDSGY